MLGQKGLKFGNFRGFFVDLVLQEGSAPRCAANHCTQWWSLFHVLLAAPWSFSLVES